MDNLLSIETRFRDHFERTATVDGSGWERLAPSARPDYLAGMRAALARRLIALAARLAPPAITTPTAINI